MKSKPLNEIIIHKVNILKNGIAYIGYPGGSIHKINPNTNDDNNSSSQRGENASGKILFLFSFLKAVAEFKQEVIQ